MYVYMHVVFMSVIYISIYFPMSVEFCKNNWHFGVPTFLINLGNHRLFDTQNGQIR